MNNPQFNEKDALAVIQQMVTASRYNIKQDAVHLLIWGWLILSACIIHYAAILSQFPQGVYVWPTVIVIGLISSMVAGYKQGQKSEADSYIDRINRFLWLGSLAPFAITLGVGIVYEWIYAYPLLAAIFGWGNFISGGLLKYRPLIWGAVGAWIIAGAMLFVAGAEILLLMAAAILISYLIPGHMMMAQK